MACGGWARRWAIRVLVRIASSAPSRLAQPLRPKWWVEEAEALDWHVRLAGPSTAVRALSSSLSARKRRSVARAAAAASAENPAGRDERPRQGCLEGDPVRHLDVRRPQRCGGPIGQQPSEPRMVEHCDHAGAAAGPTGTRLPCARRASAIRGWRGPAASLRPGAHDARRSRPRARPSQRSTAQAARGRCGRCRPGRCGRGRPLRWPTR